MIKLGKHGPDTSTDQCVYIRRCDDV